ncbi:hypothetical protein ACWDRZ_18275 [Streptomyces sp. NPDC003509]
MVNAVGASVLSVETGIRMLINVGCPIDHAQAEIARIQSRAFKAAVRLADVTGDDAAVREYLGLPKALTTDFRCHLSRPTAGTE